MCANVFSSHKICHFFHKRIEKFLFFLCKFKPNFAKFWEKKIAKFSIFRNWKKQNKKTKTYRITILFFLIKGTEKQLSGNLFYLINYSSSETTCSASKVMPDCVRLFGLCLLALLCKCHNTHCLQLQFCLLASLGNSLSPHHKSTPRKFLVYMWRAPNNIHEFSS